jgi:Cu+-exporting ATPase
MALSSLSVVGNANRLRRWQPGPLPATATRGVTPEVRVGNVPEEVTMDQQTSTTSHVDPVCGMTVEPETAAATRTAAGVTYYFCSTHCADTFDADPARYTASATGNR